MTSSTEIADWIADNNEVLRERTAWIRDAYQKFKETLDKEILWYARYQALLIVRQEIEIELAKNLPADPYDVMILLDTPVLSLYLE